MSKYTPGPLQASRNIVAAIGSDRRLPFFVAQRYGVLCTALCDYEADAILYAAAPDLLAACKEALDYCSACGNHLDCENPSHPMMRAAIDKAEGKP